MEWGMVLKCRDEKLDLKLYDVGKTVITKKESFSSSDICNDITRSVKLLKLNDAN